MSVSLELTDVLMSWKKELLHSSRFDKSDANIKWTISLFSPVIVGILAIIVKVFFFSPLD